MSILKNTFIIYLVIGVIAACTKKPVEETKVPAPQIAEIAKNINDVGVNLPAAAGEDAFKGNCLICHSLRYIQMQPAFPQKTWEKIVDKMIKNFGAPIPDSTAKVIVNYLVSVKGKK